MDVSDLTRLTAVENENTKFGLLKKALDEFEWYRKQVPGGWSDRGNADLEMPPFDCPRMSMERTFILPKI